MNKSNVNFMGQKRGSRKRRGGGNGIDEKRESARMTKGIEEEMERDGGREGKGTLRETRDCFGGPYFARAEKCNKPLSECVDRVGRTVLWGEGGGLNKSGGL